MRVLVCGSRDWTDIGAIIEALAQLPLISTVIHGDCRGADRMAGKIAAEMGHVVEAFPADWTHHGRAAGPLRNSDMIATKPDAVLAFSHDAFKGGTGDCVRKAHHARIPVFIYPIPMDWTDINAIIYQ